MTDGLAGTEEEVKRSANHHAERCRELADILIVPLREVARRHGYALAVHGSLSYDIDLIACPWRDLAVDPEVLAKAIQTAVHAIAGYTDEHDSKEPERKPYGRLAWTFYVGGGPYVDLSVMPANDIGNRLPATGAAKEGEEG